jgi:DNA modification methylase
MAVIEQKITDKYALFNGDCVEVMSRLPEASIHLSIYSPPFATEGYGGCLYTYSSDERDLSNCTTYEQFMEMYTYCVREIFRVTMPGRSSLVHCIDVPTSNSGCDALMDFPGDIIRLHKREGFDYCGRYHIWKEPLAVRNRTMAKNLAHKTVVDDSSRCGVASADYLLRFRRRGDNPIPIAHPVGLLTYAGDMVMPAELLHYKGHRGNQIENRYSHWIWRRYADAFWDDIRIGNVLPFEESRDEEDEKHVHPLQKDVIERGAVLWSNPGENILTPFMGVGSEVCGALVTGRRGIGAELKPSYYRQAIKNCEQVIKDGGWNNLTAQHEMFETVSDAQEVAL